MSRVAAIEDMPPVARGRASDLQEIAPVHDASAVFDAVLHPNRSLPNTGFVIVMSVVIAANLVFGIYFFALGAWPVIGFCGLDVFLVWLAFKISYRQGRLHERIHITPNDMWVMRVLPSGHETRWRMHPYWTRVDIRRPIEHESQIRLSSKGRTLIVGSFLSPDERGELSRAIENALAQARG